MAKKVLISEEQIKFLKEQKGILFEYYIQASNPKKDSNILGDLQVWVYGDDRNNFTPHCHVMAIDKSTEFEVSLIDWKVINIKQGLPTKKMHKKFMKWLNARNSMNNSLSNKDFLFMTWDGTNRQNDLTDFCEKHNIIPNDEDLKKYVENQKDNNAALM